MWLKNHMLYADMPFAIAVRWHLATCKLLPRMDGWKFLAPSSAFLKVCTALFTILAEAPRSGLAGQCGLAHLTWQLAHMLLN
jgi:hypothetical protein